MYIAYVYSWHTAVYNSWRKIPHSLSLYVLQSSILALFAHFHCIMMYDLAGDFAQLAFVDFVLGFLLPCRFFEWVYTLCLKNFSLVIVHIFAKDRPIFEILLLASNIEQVASLLHAQVNSASYPQRDGKWAVAYRLWSEGLVWLIVAAVCLLTANRGSNC